MNDKTVNKELDDFKYLIDSRNLSSKEKLSEREAIMHARELRFKDRKEKDITIAKLLQIKYQMDEYLENPLCNNQPYFPKFLESYVDSLYDKRKNFAIDIDIEPTTLSHIINGHRQPKDSFIYRLIVHSEAVFENISNFDKDLWPKIFYQDKVCEFLSSSEEWKKTESKHVRNKEFLK
ncbi:hypothetical protein ERX46_17375 [Brumimicrobium glaciale]|uniref:Uncharacterized protein n=1 Tax=Brumimicrobium glaciale TaxID=200475 RepID=A0A4Q4KCZ4_9FLAO|nr:hypothetical protein [Brumimicrobium glaciale]RYM30853.1 hypothetical protein ERX46_17375 [Brumimicrobium glaciale]